MAVAVSPKATQVSPSWGHSRLCLLPHTQAKSAPPEPDEQGQPLPALSLPSAWILSVGLVAVEEKGLWGLLQNIWEVRVGLWLILVISSSISKDRERNSNCLK